MALDFISGCIGGCTGVIVGHPLDTVKVHLQTQDSRNPIYKGTFDCMRKIVAKDGVKGMFKGVTSPLGGVAFINAIVFGVYGNAQRNMSNPNSLSSHFIAGATAGLFQSFFCSPMELAKLKLQVAKTGSSTGPLECLKQIYQMHGTKGVFRGLSITVAREVPAFGSYFLAYEWLSRTDSQEPISTGRMLFAGGCAGIVSWGVVYPIDVIKTRIQLDDGTKYKNSFHCLKKSVALEGYSFLYKGLAATTLRAFPVNAATFAAVTWTMRLFRNEEIKRENELMWEKCTDAVYSLKVSETVAV